MTWDPTLTQQGQAERALPRATELVAVVHGGNQQAIGTQLDRFDLLELRAITVVLAAMVPDDIPVDELLEWVRTDPVRVLPEVQAPQDPRERVCGFPSWHASFYRHRKAGESCEECTEGERIYQKERKRDRRRAGAHEQARLEEVTAA